MPDALRRALEEAWGAPDEVGGRSAGVRAVRDLLIEGASEVRRAYLSRERLSDERALARLTAIEEDLCSRQPDVRADVEPYRGAEAGLAVVTILVAHRTELMRLPDLIGTEGLRDALGSCLPVADDDIARHLVLFMPRTKARSLREEELEGLVPELTLIGDGPRPVHDCCGCGALDDTTAVITIP